MPREPRRSREGAQHENNDGQPHIIPPLEFPQPGSGDEASNAQHITMVYDKRWYPQWLRQPLLEPCRP